MLLKDYCKTKKKSIRQIALNTNIPYSTLNDLINQKTDFNRVSFGMICAIADELELSIDDLRQMLSADKPVHADNDKPYSVIVRNKCYYIEIDGRDRMYLCKVNPVTTFSIDDIASWKYREFATQKEMEEIDALYCNAQK